MMPKNNNTHTTQANKRNLTTQKELQNPGQIYWVCI